MKKQYLIMLLMLAAALALVACDAAIPGTGSDEPESEQTAPDAASEEDVVEAPVESAGEEAGEPAEGTVPEEDSAEASGRIVTAWIGPELVDCVGVAPQKCMQVKTNPDDDYGLFYDQIEGFEFEEGYEYELRVLVEPVQNPPADASALTYTLVELVSKTPVTVEQPAADIGPADEALALEGVTWLLESYINLEGQPTESQPDTRLTIAFADAQVAGSAGCNNFFGPYEVDGSALTIGPLGSTMKACFPEEVMLQETAYLANLGKVAAYEIVGSQLELRDADGQTLLSFTEDESLSLLGTVWSVTGYNNGTGGVTSVVIDTEMSAIFTAEGTVGGSAGCNNYRAGYQADGGSIAIGPSAVTRKLCAEPEGIMEQEALYLAALEMAANYEVEGANMDMYDADGSRVVTFVAAMSVEEAAEAAVEESTVELPVVVAGDGSEAAAADGVEKTIYVGPEMVDCEGEGPQKCLLVKDSPDGEYGLHYFPIEGFAYEPGFEYELVIREETVENPPAGGTSLRWVLVNEVSKTPAAAADSTADAAASEAAAPAAVVLPGSSWQWLQMVTPVETVVVDDSSKYIVDFLADGIVSIQADCNSGSGTYEANDGAIAINITATTLALCADDSLSDLFIRSLNASAIYFDQNGNLFIDLFADAGTMEFAPN